MKNKYGSLYWDDFDRRIKETANSLSIGKFPPIRRVAIFITNKCNFRCSYCNLCFGNKQMSKNKFIEILNKYGSQAIIHITGGEPSTVNWLYPLIEKTKNIKFHLNTNAYITPPKNIERLKVSMDSYKDNVFEKITNVVGSFKRVVNNIKKATEHSLVSITYVLSKKTYKDSPEFMQFAIKEFPKLYAVFFSAYKGNNPEFVMDKSDVNYFFNDIRFKLENQMDNESLWLFKNTLDNKRRIMQGIRFPENKINLCYLCLSEKVYDFNDIETNCSHLYRDGIYKNNCNKVKKCLYGCNRKLVMFNEEVIKKLKGGKNYDTIKRQV